MELKAEINVTPLVDVCLVLLIIFMLVTPILIGRPTVQLPETKNPSNKPDSENKLTISILRDSTICIDSNWISKRELLERMKGLHERAPEKEILIRADRSLTYGNVKQVMNALRQTKFEKVGLITERSSVSN